MHQPLSLGDIAGDDHLGQDHQVGSLAKGELDGIHAPPPIGLDGIRLGA
jgi:hypothetical protein